MTKYFVVAFVATSALLAGLGGGALAHSRSRINQPTSPADTSPWAGQSGTASYYGAAHQGRRTADGSRFDQMALTAAHPWLPFGTKVKVTLASTRRTVIVTITDRLPPNQRIVDLSYAAARQIGMVHQGLGEVTLLPI